MNLHQREDEHYCHLTKKLNNPQSNPKTYWSVLKTLFNGRKIPPLLIDSKLVSDFKEKAN